MTFDDFLTRVIDDGIKAVKDSYREARQAQKLEGSIAGFESCRGRSVFELRQQLDIAQKLADIAMATDRGNYWYHRCFHAEVEWVCNVVSAALQNSGEIPIVTPTARGYLKAADILGVKGNMTLREFLERREN